MLKRIICVGAFVVSVTVVSVLSGAEREMIEAILIRVNDRIVTVTEFEERFRQELAQMPSPPDQGSMAAFRNGLLENMVNEMILLERAEEKNIVVDEEAVDQAIAGLREENNLLDDAAFEEALQQSGLTADGLRDRYRKSFMVQRASQGEIRQTEITQEELKARYEQEKERFAVPAKVELQQMIFPVAADGTDLEAVEGRVQSMLKRIKDGADVKAEATLAGVELQELGSIPVQDLRPELVDMLDPVEEGNFSELAVTPAGIQVLRLVKRIPAGYRPFEEVEGEIRREEAERAFFEQRSGFIDRLKADYMVEVHRDRLAAPDGGTDG